MTNFRSAICALALLSLVSAHAEDQSSTVKMADLPPATRKAIREQLGKGKLGNIEKSTEDGEVTYSVEMKKGGKMRDYTFDEGGGLLDEEVFLNETPPAVQAAINKLAGTNQLDDITKSFDDEGNTYDIDMIKNGTTRTFTVDEAGKLTEEQVSLAELPGPVQRAALKELGGRTPGDITKLFDDGDISYEVGLDPAGKYRTVTFDPNGAVISREVDVPLSDTPEVVQKAIHELVKDGQLGSITKVTDEDGVTYDVELKHGGKWEAVTVGSDGKIVP